MSILERKRLQNLACEAESLDDGRLDQTTASESRRLDCIYDNDPLGFEKNPQNETQKMQAQDPLEEIDLGNGTTKRPTYISTKVGSEIKANLVEVLNKYKDCFARDYDEMPGLDQSVVEHRLPIQPGKKPVKQHPRRFTLNVTSKIKQEIERLLKSRFIRTTRYVEWRANIVLVIKKNETLRICIDFRDLNNTTPKDEYSMSMAEILVDSTIGFEYLSLLDGYSDYNQILIAEEDVPKTAFQCPGVLGTYE